jgi:hypothetical protein
MMTRQEWAAWNYNTVVVQATLLQYLAVVALLFGESALGATSIAAANIFGYWPTIIMYGGSATLALISMFVQGPRKLPLLLPQYIGVMLECVGAAMAVYNGYYADLVERPRPFIFGDQRVYLVFGLIYWWRTIAYHVDRLTSEDWKQLCQNC